MPLKILAENLTLLAATSVLMTIRKRRELRKNLPGRLSSLIIVMYYVLNIFNEISCAMGILF